MDTTRQGRPLPGANVVEVELYEAAARAGVHRRTMLRWARSGYVLARQYPRRTRGARWLVRLDPETGRPATPA